MKMFRLALTLALCSLLALLLMASGAPPVAHASSVGPHTTSAVRDVAGDMGSLTGYVKDALTGTGMGGVQVTFSHKAAVLVTKTDATGSYSFPMLPTGQGTVTATAQGYTSQTINVEIIANQLIQAPDILLVPATPKWEKVMGGSQEDGLHSIAPTDDGGYITAGWTWSYGAGGADAWVIKLDANGNEMWSKTYGAGGHDYFQSIAPTGDGGYIAAGWTQSGDIDAWVVRLDSNGGEVWEKTLGGNGSDLFFQIVKTSDGGFVAAGWTQSYGEGDNDGWVTKLDANGNQLWNQVIDMGDNDNFYSVAPTSDGGYIAAGMTFPLGYGDGWVVKLDGSGREVWNRHYGADYWDYLYSIAPLTNGDYIAVGMGGGDNGWATRLDADGNQVWSKNFGGSAMDWLYSVTPTNDDVIYAAGWTRSFGNTEDGWVVKMDGNGNVIWDKAYNPAGYDLLYSIAPTGDKGLVIAGFSAPVGLPKDGWVVKMDANGDAGGSRLNLGTK